MQTGKLVISLDFELFWGVRDKRTIASYGTNVANEHDVIPKMLQLFNKYGVHVTWATVGFLFCENKSEIGQFSPKLVPSYTDTNLSPYKYIDVIGNNREDDPYHYASDLVKMIKDTPGQELATHTFSHYYCLEPGQSIAEFEADLDAAIKVADKYGTRIQSIVFPRNQYSESYLSVCMKSGIRVYRGNEQHWAYASHNGSNNGRVKRLYRLVDSYFNLSGYHTYALTTNEEPMINIHASRFLRPYSNRLKSLEWLKLRRIYKAMDYAAKNGQVYHLWWHPHNFGANIEQNLQQLENILQHYVKLCNSHNMMSMTMGEFFD